MKVIVIELPKSIKGVVLGENIYVNSLHYEEIRKEAVEWQLDTSKKEKEISTE